MWAIAERLLNVGQNAGKLSPDMESATIRGGLKHFEGIGIDAFHIAASVANGMDFIVSWNFHHIANAFVKEKIRRINDSLGVVSPEICTPEELVENKENQNEE